MRYPTKFALAMIETFSPPHSVLDAEECIIVRQRDVSWQRQKIVGFPKWGRITIGVRPFVCIPIEDDDLNPFILRETLRLAAQAAAESGDIDRHIRWYFGLTTERRHPLLTELMLLRRRIGIEQHPVGTTFVLDDYGFIEVGPSCQAGLIIPDGKPVPVPEPEPKRKRKHKDMTETAAETKDKSPKVVIKMEGVSPLGQAIWPSLEPILEARLSVLRSEMLAKEVRPMQITIADRPKIELEGEHLHPAVMEALAAVGRGEDLFLVGPPGSGKTYMAEQLAKMLGYETAMISFNEQTMSSDMFGRYVVNDKGGMDWHDGPVPAAFRAGKTVIIMDEVDRANPNTVDGLNSAIANRRCNLPQRRETLRSTEVVFVACANAYAADATNTSSNTLAASFYDRFWRMEIGYDKTLEERYLAFNMPLLQKLWAIRDAVVEHKLRRHVSTRFVIRAARASKGGMKNDDVLKQLVLGWRKEEKDKLKSLLPGGA